MTREGPIEISIAEMEKAITQGVTSADPERAEGLAQLTRLSEAREAGLRREYARLSKVLPQDDPRLEGLILRIEAGQVLRREAEFEISRSTSGIPTPQRDSWILYGFVRDADAAFLDAHRVVLVDVAGAPIKGTETDIGEDARFVMRIQAKDEIGRNDFGRSAAASRRLQVFAGLIDARGRLVYVDRRGLEPQLGRIAYLEISVKAEPRGAPEKPPPDDKGPDRPKEEAPKDDPSETERRPPRRQARRTGRARNESGEAG